MKIRYFEDTDTLLIELKPGSVAETRDLDENTLLDLDAQVRSWPSRWSTPPRGRSSAASHLTV